MTLATRCAACGTTFRVVQDQLRVSEGWVRCGQCGEVFNALEGLVDLSWAQTPPADADAVATDAAQEPESAAVQVPDSIEAGAGDADAGTESRAPAEAFLAPTLPDDTAAAPPSGPSDGAHDAQQPENATPGADFGAHGDAEPEENEPPPPPPTEAMEDGVLPAASTDHADHPPAASPKGRTKSSRRRARRPGFVRQAERAARWDRPRVRTGLAALSAVLAVVLVTQLALQFHDTLASRWHATRAPLAALCRIAGCTLDAPRRLGSLVVESAALNEVADDGTATHHLALAVRNQSAQAVALPAFDLSLTDATGDIVARRVITPEQIGSPAQAIAASSEWTAQIPLQLADRRVSGFSIEIFYP